MHGKYRSIPGPRAPPLTAHRSHRVHACNHTLATHAYFCRACCLRPTPQHMSQAASTSRGLHSPIKKSRRPRRRAEQDNNFLDSLEQAEQRDSEVLRSFSVGAMPNPKAPALRLPRELSALETDDSRPPTSEVELLFPHLRRQQPNQRPCRATTNSGNKAEVFPPHLQELYPHLVGPRITSKSPLVKVIVEQPTGVRAGPTTRSATRITPLMQGLGVPSDKWPVLARVGTNAQGSSSSVDARANSAPAASQQSVATSRAGKAVISKKVRSSNDKAAGRTRAANSRSRVSRAPERGK